MRKTSKSLILAVFVLALSAASASASTKSLQARVDFKIYSPSYFAGFSFKTFTLSDGKSCADHSRPVFVLGGKGTFGNNYPGVDIFEKAAKTCGSGTGFNTRIANVLINGHSAQVWSNCAGVPAGKCGAVQVKANGGLITWTVSAVTGYKPTTVSVTTYNLAYSVLLAVARGIK